MKSHFHELFNLSVN